MERQVVGTMPSDNDVRTEASGGPLAAGYRLGRARRGWQMTTKCI